MSFYENTLIFDAVCHSYVLTRLNYFQSVKILCSLYQICLIWNNFFFSSAILQPRVCWLIIKFAITVFVWNILFKLLISVCRTVWTCCWSWRRCDGSVLPWSRHGTSTCCFTAPSGGSSTTGWRSLTTTRTLTSQQTAHLSATHSKTPWTHA